MHVAQKRAAVWNTDMQKDKDLERITMNSF